jgi:hypothetical protein
VSPVSVARATLAVTEGGAMVRWADVEREAPELAARARGLFARGVNKTIATLRADGAPRISGTELEFEDGEVTLGMMGGSRKLADVRRDPRVAIHCPTPDATTDDWPGDAKVAGTLVPVAPPADNPIADAGYFRLDVTELVVTSLNETRDRLVVESWHPGRGTERLART